MRVHDKQEVVSSIDLGLFLDRLLSKCGGKGAANRKLLGVPDLCEQAASALLVYNNNKHG